MKLRIGVLANTARYILNFRINLMKALSAEGYEVVALSPEGSEVSLIEKLGFHHISLPIRPMSTHPLKELNTVLVLRKILHDSAVDVVLSSTPKGNLYTALSNQGTKRHQIANVSGLGSAYLRQNWLSRIVNVLYSATFGSINHVLFENPTDYKYFIKRGWTKTENASVIPGLGVDLEYFQPEMWPVDDEAGIVRFLMIARIIGDKGVREFVEAARQIRALWPQARFELLGDSSAENPTGIKAKELNTWLSQGDIIHYEHTEDVRPYIKRAHCIVLPSYREGMSRTLLEGAAMGRPLIASDVPGCREAIEVGINGYLCQARCATSLADAIAKFLNLTKDQQKAMGNESRKKISLEFSEKIVIERYISLIKELH